MPIKRIERKKATNNNKNVLQLSKCDKQTKNITTTNNNNNSLTQQIRSVIISKYANENNTKRLTNQQSNTYTHINKRN